MMSATQSEFEEFKAFAVPLSGLNLIEASAGTGKTWNITALYLRFLLEKQLPIDKILVVTFTHAATDELRGRIRERLSTALAYLKESQKDRNNQLLLKDLVDDEAEREFLDRFTEDPAQHQKAIATLRLAVESFDQSAVFTIHSFCQKVLAEAAFSSAQAFSTEVEADDSGLVLEVVNDYWREKIAKRQFSPVFSTWLEKQQFTPDMLVKQLQRRMKKPLAELEWPEELHDPEWQKGADRLMETISLDDLKKKYEDAARAWENEKNCITELLKEARTKRILKDDYNENKIKAASAAWSRLFEVKNEFEIIRYVNHPQINLLTPQKLKAGKYAQTKEFYKANNGKNPDSEKEYHRLTNELHKICGETEDLSESGCFLQLAYNLLDTCNKTKEETFEKLRLKLLKDFLETAPDRLKAKKREQRTIAFDDMLTNLHDALENNQTLEIHQKLSEVIREKYPVALIDEFQDTDPIQCDIFLGNDDEGEKNICGIYDANELQERNAVFLVGDPKQAIYRFRNADVHTYLAVKSKAGHKYTLDTNRRSANGLIGACNTLFSKNPDVFCQKGLRFTEVSGAGKKENDLIDSSGDTATGKLRIWLLPEHLQSAEAIANAAIQRIGEWQKKRAPEEKPYTDEIIHLVNEWKNCESSGISNKNLSDEDISGLKFIYDEIIYLVNEWKNNKIFIGIKKRINNIKASSHEITALLDEWNKLYKEEKLSKAKAQETGKELVEKWASYFKRHHEEKGYIIEKIASHIKNWVQNANLKDILPFFKGTVDAAIEHILEISGENRKLSDIEPKLSKTEDIKTRLDKISNLAQKWRNAELSDDEKDDNEALYAIDYEKVITSIANGITNLLEPWRKNRWLKRSEAKDLAIKTTADEIERLIKAGTAGKCLLKDSESKKYRGLEAGDITVLVRSHAEAETARQELKKRGIGSVSLLQDSVFQSNEAHELECILHAMASPSDEALLKAAVSTEILGFDSEDDLFKLDGGPTDPVPSSDAEKRLSELIECFTKYHEHWQKYGVAYALNRLLEDTLPGKDKSVMARLLGLDGADRRLTNLRQLVELVSQSKESKDMPDALLRWYRSRRDDENTAEEERLRLETDDRLVKIFTIHSSKGLEFPIVFCPLLWDNRSFPTRDLKDGIEYHGKLELEESDVQNEAPNKTVIDYRLLPEEGGNNKETLKNKRKFEDDAETLRLMYVALTRASYRCYLVAGCYLTNHFGNYYVSKSCKSLLNWIAAGNSVSMKEEDLFSAWHTGDKAENRVDDIIKAWWDLPKQVMPPEEKPYPKAEISIQWMSMPDEGNTVPSIGKNEEETAKPEAKKGFTGKIPASSVWRTASFSSLTRKDDSAEDDVESGHKEHDQRINGSGNTDSSANKPGASSDGENDSGNDEKEHKILLFPAGTYAGSCLHAVFENADFTNPSTWEAAADKALSWYPQQKKSGKNTPEVDLKAAIGEMLEDVLSTSLLSDNGTDIILKDVKNEDKRTELPFYLQKASLSDDKLNILLEKYGYNTPGGNEIPELEFKSMTAYLNGFIDLVFRANGKFWLLDWKSNYLGNSKKDYSPEKIRHAMNEHGYHLQYLFYTLALHRYLKSRISGYDYGKHFGGVFYLFVRGVRPEWEQKDGSPAGVFFCQPKQELIEELDTLFGNDSNEESDESI